MQKSKLLKQAVLALALATALTAIPAAPAYAKVKYDRYDRYTEVNHEEYSSTEINRDLDFEDPNNTTILKESQIKKRFDEIHYGGITWLTLKKEYKDPVEIPEDVHVDYYGSKYEEKGIWLYKVDDGATSVTIPETLTYKGHELHLGIGIKKARYLADRDIGEEEEGYGGFWVKYHPSKTVKKITFEKDADFGSEYYLEHWFPNFNEIAGYTDFYYFKAEYFTPAEDAEAADKAPYVDVLHENGETEIHPGASSFANAWSLKAIKGKSTSKWKAWCGRYKVPFLETDTGKYYPNVLSLTGKLPMTKAKYIENDPNTDMPYYEPVKGTMVDLSKKKLLGIETQVGQLYQFEDLGYNHKEYLESLRQEKLIRKGKDHTSMGDVKISIYPADELVKNNYYGIYDEIEAQVKYKGKTYKLNSAKDDLELWLPKATDSKTPKFKAKFRYVKEYKGKKYKGGWSKWHTVTLKRNKSKMDVKSIKIG